MSTAVETAERFAEGLATVAELHLARDQAMNSIDTSNPSATRGLVPRLKVAASSCVKQTNGMLNLLENLRLDAELSTLAPGLFRCVFGPDPKRALSISRDWLDSNVQNLALTLYENRNFDLMPILGDALEEAGCADMEVLQHCRKGDRHVRGCWVVDLILGKS